MKFRLAKDKWIARDKAEHMVRDSLLFIITFIIFNNFWTAFWIATAFAFLWEIKDGFLKWEIYGWWGGDGFSYKDILAGTLAILIIYYYIILYFIILGAV